MMISISSCVVLFVLIASTLASYGEYIPKSYYIIDNNGHRSDIVYIRSRRDLLPIFRHGRSAGGGSSAQANSHANAQGNAQANAHAHATASATSGSGSGSGIGFDPNFVIPEFSNFASNFPAGFADGSALNAIGSLAGAGPSGFPGHPGGQQGGAGQHPGYNGPILFSRFGETEGQGVVASGTAQGPNAAFSSVQTSSDNGKVKYGVKSGHY